MMHVFKVCFAAAAQHAVPVPVVEREDLLHLANHTGQGLHPEQLLASAILNISHNCSTKRTL